MPPSSPERRGAARPDTGARPACASPCVAARASPESGRSSAAEGEVHHPASKRSPRSPRRRGRAAHPVRCAPRTWRSRIPSRAASMFRSSLQRRSPAQVSLPPRRMGPPSRRRPGSGRARGRSSGRPESPPLSAPRHRTLPARRKRPRAAPWKRPGREESRVPGSRAGSFASSLPYTPASIARQGPRWMDQIFSLSWLIQEGQMRVRRSRGRLHVLPRHAHTYSDARTASIGGGVQENSRTREAVFDVGKSCINRDLRGSWSIGIQGPVPRSRDRFPLDLAPPWCTRSAESVDRK
jgi:hypothetical protein